MSYSEIISESAKATKKQVLFSPWYRIDQYAQGVDYGLLRELTESDCCKDGMKSVQDPIGRYGM
jgi:hypothetical protein